MTTDKKYPLTLAGLYKSSFTQRFVANTVPIDQQRADEMCAAIQACVGGRLEVREWGGTGKNGKPLPEYKIEALTAEQVAERKAYGEQKKAERQAQSDGDGAL